MSILKAQLQEDMKDAMRAKQKQRLDAIRLILAAVKQKEVDERIVLDDQHILTILDKMVKQRRDSIQQYQQAARADLVDQEQFELDLIKAYMPQELSAAEIEQLIKQAIAQTNASSMKEMGAVMAVLRPQLQGRADMALVSSQIKALLG